MGSHGVVAKWCKVLFAASENAEAASGQDLLSHFLRANSAKHWQESAMSISAVKDVALVEAAKISHAKVAEDQAEKGVRL